MNTANTAPSIAAPTCQTGPLSAIGAEGPEKIRDWTAEQAIIYALGCGCGMDELAFVTERAQRVLPTFAGVVPRTGAWLPPALRACDATRSVHGAQAIELFAPLPVAGTVRSRKRITEVWDKGSSMVVVAETLGYGVHSGEALFRNTSTAVFRGAGGFGGERGPGRVPFQPPRPEPDAIVRYDVPIGQALLYRLSGDRNPHNVYADVAHAQGFDGPILTGMCTFGFAGRALLDRMCGSDPARFGSISGRFSSPTYPGRPLDVHIWTDGEGAVFQVHSAGRVVLNNGVFQRRSATA